MRRKPGDHYHRATPHHEYLPNTWGAREADAIIAGDGNWHNPTVRELKRAPNSF